jgi:hypothetical protein
VVGDRLKKACVRHAHDLCLLADDILDTVNVEDRRETT